MIDQVLLTRLFSNQFIEACLDMRNKQKAFYDMRRSKHMPFNDPIVKQALHDSIEAEKKVDTMIESIQAKPQKPKQYDMFEE